MFEEDLLQSYDPGLDSDEDPTAFDDDDDSNDGWCLLCLLPNREVEREVERERSRERETDHTPHTTHTHTPHTDSYTDTQLIPPPLPHPPHAAHPPSSL